MGKYTISASATSMRLVIMLSLIKTSYPARLSARALQEALESVGYPYSLRAVQRHLNGFAEINLIDCDGEMPQGWRLTQVGKEFLGVQS